MILVLLVAAALAQDDDWGDGGDDAGFGDFDVPEVDAPPPPPKPLQVGFTVRKDDAVWLSKQPVRFAKARQTLDVWTRYSQDDFRAELAVHGEVDLMPWVIESDFDQASKRVYGRQLFVREAFLAASEGPVDFTLGRQVVAWGTGQLINPVDVVNPRDLREPGLADLDDIRLPIGGARLGWFGNGHRVELLVVPVPEWGLRTPPNGPFGPLPGLLSDAPELVQSALGDRELDYVHTPGQWEPGHTQTFARWTHTGEGLDTGIYAASVLDQQGILSLPEPAVILQDGPIDIPLDHPRYTMLGASAAGPAGPFVLRGEVAMNLDKPINVGQLDGLLPQLGTAEATLVTAMVGGSWQSGSSAVDVELSEGFFHGGPPDDLLFRPDSGAMALRFSQTAARERLRFDVVGLGWGWDLRYGAIVRASASYTLRDGMKVMLGAITYREGREVGPTVGLGEHERVYWQWRWDV